MDPTFGHVVWQFACQKFAFGVRAIAKGHYWLIFIKLALQESLKGMRSTTSLNLPTAYRTMQPRLMFWDKIFIIRRLFGAYRGRRREVHIPVKPATHSGRKLKICKRFDPKVGQKTPSWNPRARGWRLPRPWLFRTRARFPAQRVAQWQRAQDHQYRRRQNGAWSASTS